MDSEYDRINQQLAAFSDQCQDRRVYLATEPVGRFTNPEDTRAHVRLICCLSGTRLHRWLVGGRFEEHCIKPGECLVAAGHTLDFTAYTEANQTLSIVLYPDHTRFVNVVCDRPARGLAHAGQAKYIVELPVVLDQQGQATLQALLCTPPASPGWVSQALLRVLLESCARLLNSRPAQSQDAGRMTWLRIYTYVMENFTQPINREDVARAARVHPNHVSRLYRQHAQCAFVEDLLEHRLTHAAGLLRQSSQQVQAVADAAGFQNTTHFNRQFKARFGCSPSQYRRLSGTGN